METSILNERRNEMIKAYLTIFNAKILGWEDPSHLVAVCDNLLSLKSLSFFVSHDEKTILSCMCRECLKNILTDNPIYIDDPDLFADNMPDLREDYGSGIMTIVNESIGCTTYSGVFNESFMEFNRNYLDDDLLDKVAEEKEAEDEDKEDEVRMYHVKILIGYHRDYTIFNLNRRVKGRMLYRNNEYLTELLAIGVGCTNNEYEADIFFTSTKDLDYVKGMMNHRFGKTSGKPWYRSSINLVEDITDKNDGDGNYGS